MPISNMQQPRQMYNEGGMLMQDPQYNQQSMYNEGGMIPQDMNQDMGLMAPRQNYGLGSFVKKAIRGVKKVAKSPIGKMALMYAGTAGLGALAGGAGGTGFGMSMFRPSNIMSNFGGSGIGNLFKGGAKTGGGMFSKMGDSGGKMRGAL